MKKRKLFYRVLLVGLICLTSSALKAQTNDASTIDAQQKIPLDPNVKTGTFKNGFTYYIRHNDKPEDQLQLRLVVNAGSILEKPNQLGMAHLMEHMNFNGSKHFKKNELVTYLQNIGIKFGADLNASTGFNRTLYILPIPTDSMKNVNKGFQILEDWAHNASLSSDMIHDERGVVLEEYRGGLGAGKRMQREYLPIILKGSRYIKRNPIGTKQSILHSSNQSLRNFYHDWYRPELEAVIAVGDLPTETMYKKIEKHFANIPTLKNVPKRKVYSIPNHKKTRIAIVSDSEATNSRVQVIYMNKNNRKPAQTVGDFRHQLDRILFSIMVNNRLNKIEDEPAPPFANAGTSYGRYYSPQKNAYSSSAVCNEEGCLKALKTLMVVNKRVKDHGFLASELDRAKKDLLSSFEARYKGRKTVSSSSYIGGYVANYLSDNPIPGITWQYNKAKKILPKVTLSEVSSLIDKYVHKDNRSVLVTGPPLNDSKDTLKQKIRNVLADVASQKVNPYEEKKVRDKLMESKPKMGSIVKQSVNDSLGATTFDLSNGSKVVYKKTDFKDNQILFYAFSFGGTSLYSNKTYKQIALAKGGLTQAGIAELSKEDLKKVLSGKNASVSPFISGNLEGMKGGSTKDDMNTMFQLIHLYFTSLNKDSSAFQSYISKVKTAYAKRLSNPNVYFSSKFKRYIFGQGNPRYIGYPTPEKLDNADYNLAYKMYQERFANAGDFTFYFVGDIPISTFRKDVQKYLASLPSSGKHENYKDLPYRPLSGSHKKVIHKGQASKSNVVLYYNGETSFNPNKKLALNLLGNILTIKLTENLREKESGVYSVNAKGSLSKIPHGSFSFNIGFSCDPDNVEKLKKDAINEVEKIVKNGPTSEDLEKVKKHKLLAYKKGIKKNGFWLNALLQPAINETNKRTFLHYENQLGAITREDIQKIAKEYLTNGHITGILYPENYEQSSK